MAKRSKRFTDEGNKRPHCVYKVWIEIEEYNEQTERGETLDAPGAAVAEFPTYDDAYAFAERLQSHGEREAERS